MTLRTRSRDCPNQSTSVKYRSYENVNKANANSQFVYVSPLFSNLIKLIVSLTTIYEVRFGHDPYIHS